MSDAPGGAKLLGVLIDDDPLVRMTWAIAARRAGGQALFYSTPAEFFEAAGGIPQSAPIYVDIRLGGGCSGLDAARRIRALGFDEIYLATGDAPSRPPDFIRAVVGKEPPWG